MNCWKDNILLKIANIVGCLGFLGSNIYIYVTSGGVYRTGKETYFSPAHHVYLIWPLIHLLLLGYIMYQFTDNGKGIIINIIGWRFPLWMVLNVAYLHSWEKGQYGVAFIIAFFLAIMVTVIMADISNYPDTHDVTFYDRLWILVPILIYHIWAPFLFIISGFEAFGVDASTHPAGVYTKVFVFLGLWFIESMPSIEALSTTGEGVGILLSIPTTWILFAIFEHHHASEFVHWTALVFTVSAFGAFLKNLHLAVCHFRNATPLRDAERAPLLYDY